MASLQNKHLVVFGGSSGIGLEVAQQAAALGADLTLVGRNEERLQQAQSLLLEQGTNVSRVVVDAHDHVALREAFEQIQPFDHLVSMVGDAMGGGFLNADMSLIEKVIHSKFLTNVLIGKLAAEKIRVGGSITYTAGTGGRAQNACASYVGNQGIVSLAQGLAAELAPKARVNCVAPTWTVTPFWRHQAEEQVDQTRQHFAEIIPLKRTAEIDELASAYLFLMQNDFITGQQIAVDGGIMLG
ncbi:SDR family NAD(P)-dependent oxidoreductase [Pantoea rwandensis]|uniref:Short-chain dehydrogenase n=1 Tax=Pantoea rwandensis TaxID=1076550 RepID=A0A1X1CRN1_9GAMM|nr:SDR family oxidoreductase [Pantoea rwandensis]ORM67103.1 short-chain dehydrogenase [Pantoea rwandensis]